MATTPSCRCYILCGGRPLFAQFRPDNADPAGDVTGPLGPRHRPAPPAVAMTEGPMVRADSAYAREELRRGAGTTAWPMSSAWPGNSRLADRIQWYLDDAGAEAESEGPGGRCAPRPGGATLAHRFTPFSYDHSRRRSVFHTSTPLTTLRRLQHRLPIPSDHLWYGSGGGAVPFRVRCRPPSLSPRYSVRLLCARFHPLPFEPDVRISRIPPSGGIMHLARGTPVRGHTHGPDGFARPGFQKLHGFTRAVPLAVAPPAELQFMSLPP